GVLHQRNGVAGIVADADAALPGGGLRHVQFARRLLLRRLPGLDLPAIGRVHLFRRALGAVDALRPRFPIGRDDLRGGVGFLRWAAGRHQFLRHVSDDRRCGGDWKLWFYVRGFGLNLRRRRLRCNWRWNVLANRRCTFASNRCRFTSVRNWRFFMGCLYSGWLLCGVRLLHPRLGVAVGLRHGGREVAHPVVGLHQLLADFRHVGGIARSGIGDIGVVLFEQRSQPRLVFLGEPRRGVL